MKFDLAIVNKVFLASNLIEAVDPYLINEGECFKWAWCVYKLFGGQLCSVAHHAFFKIDLKYYDAECLSGDYDWRKLRVNKECDVFCCRRQIEFMDEDEFCSVWGLDSDDMLPLLAEIKKTIF